MFFFMSGISLLFLQNKLFYDIHDILGAKDNFDYNLYTSLIKNMPYISILVRLTIVFFCNILQLNWYVIVNSSSKQLVNCKVVVLQWQKPMVQGHSKQWPIVQIYGTKHERKKYIPLCDSIYNYTWTTINYLVLRNVFNRNCFAVNLYCQIWFVLRDLYNE